MFRLFLTTLLLLLFTLPTMSQVQVSDAEMLIQSRHIWRGEKLGTAPAIEPSVTFSANRLSFNIWASVTTNNSYSEIDLIPAWQFSYFQLTLLDYYNPKLGQENHYLNLQEERSRHSLELTFDNFSVDKQRFKWMLGTFLLGDKNEETGNSFYSTYLEFKYPFTLLDIDIEPYVGLTPFHGLYATKFNVVNIGVSFVKSVSITQNLSVPLSITLISKPSQNNYFLALSSGIVFSKLK